MSPQDPIGAPKSAKTLKNCKSVFVTQDSWGKGRILDGPQSWHGQKYVDQVDALLGSDWVVKFADSAGAIWADHATAKREGRATLTFNWSPNFTDAEGIVFIEWPPYYPGCRKQDCGDGICGSPIGRLKKAAWSGMPLKWPAAFEVFSRISFTTKMIGAMASYEFVSKMEPADAATRWIQENKKVWTTWLDLSLKGQEEAARRKFEKATILSTNSNQVWCATKYFYRQQTESSCKDQSGKSYSNKNQAEAAHNRLKPTGDYPKCEPKRLKDAWSVDAERIRFAWKISKDLKQYMQAVQRYGGLGDLTNVCQTAYELETVYSSIELFRIKQSNLSAQVKEEIYRQFAETTRTNVNFHNFIKKWCIGNRPNHSRFYGKTLD